MAMFPIATATVTSSGPYAATFYNIPQTFTHLQVRAFFRGTAASQTVPLLIQFNDDISNPNYAYHDLKGDGGVTSAANTNATFSNTGYGPGSSATSNVWGNSIIDILDYTSTAKNKTVKAITGYDANGSGYVGVYSGLWKPTTPVAINSILLYLGNAAVGTRVDLYGITTSQTTGA